MSIWTKILKILNREVPSMKKSLFLSFLLLISIYSYSQDELTISNLFSKGDVNLSNCIQSSKVYTEFKPGFPYLEDIGSPLINCNKEFIILENFDVNNYKIEITEYSKTIYNATQEVEYVKKLNKLPDIENTSKFELWTDMGKNNEIFSSTEVYKSSSLDRIDKVSDDSYIANFNIFPLKYDCKNNRWIKIDLRKEV